MISTLAAVLGAAAIGGTALASHNAAQAAKKAGQIQAESDAASLALQEKIYNQNRADNEWQRQLGMTASSAVARNFGLTTGGVAGGSGQVTMTGSPDWNAYLANNPDVAEYGASHPNDYGDVNGDGQITPTDFAQGHYQKFGKNENRALPTVGAPADQPPADPNAPQPGYSDPTAVGGYTTPVRMTQAPLDVSGAAYQRSPGFDWQLEQGQNALDHVASAGGGVMSGQRAKAALRYSQGLAQQDYGDWRNFTAGQYNADRNYGEAVYQSDRSRLDNRYDTRNNQLLALSGFGQAATAANQSAAQSFAANSTNLMTDSARARADGVTGAANAWNQGIGNLMSLGAYTYGAYGARKQ